jgi:hypothetical protein
MTGRWLAGKWEKAGNYDDKQMKLRSGTPTL